MMDNDGANSSTGGSDRDKGRGSYKCGRVSVILGSNSFISVLLVPESDLKYVFPFSSIYSVAFRRKVTYVRISPS